MSTGLTFQKYLMSGRRSFTVVPKEPHPSLFHWVYHRWQERPVGGKRAAGLWAP